MQKQAPKVFYIKKLFLRILLYLQETPMLKFLFNEVAGLQAYKFIKRDSNAGVFLWILAFFKDNYFEEHLWTAASNCGNLAVFWENLLYWVEEINYLEQGKLAILRRTIH